MALFAFPMGIVGLIVTGLPIVGLLCAIAGTCLPRLLDARRSRQQGEQIRAAWPDVIDGLTSAVRAGMSLPEAVCAVGTRGPACLAVQFQSFAADFRATGNFESSLIRLRDRLADPVADRVTEALLAARDVGGTDLGRMLRTLSDFVRQDLRLRGEAAARQSWTINGARLAVGAPWVVLLMLSTRPGTVQAYQTGMGMIILVAAAALSGFAYWVMLKIGRLPDEKRVLA